MTTIGAAAPPVKIAEREAVPRITAQTGAVSFSDLVRPNFRREDERKRNSGVANDEAQAVGYMTFKALVSHADAFDSKVLRDFAKERIGDWGIIGRKSAWAGLDMGVDFLGAGPIPMFADGEIVRVVRSR